MDPCKHLSLLCSHCKLKLRCHYLEMKHCEAWGEIKISSGSSYCWLLCTLHIQKREGSLSLEGNVWCVFIKLLPSDLFIFKKPCIDSLGFTPWIPIPLISQSPHSSSALITSPAKQNFKVKTNKALNKAKQNLGMKAVWHSGSHT